ncbi:MAG: hypothetical protein AB1Z31_23415 [Desulfobacterales bacterium]
MAITCLVFSVIIGIGGAWLQGSRLKWTRRIVQGYIQFFRNTPPLVQLYFFLLRPGRPDAENTERLGGIRTASGQFCLSGDITFHGDRYRDRRRSGCPANFPATAGPVILKDFDPIF